MNAPLVSVIVPNYNYAASLPLCIRAVQAQTYQRLELIVVDDCSTDDSARIAADLGARVVRTPVNGGVSAARNLGAQLASGEILVFIDSDVAAHPDAVANAVALLAEQPALGAVCGVHDPEPLIRDSLFEEYRALQYHYWSVSSEGLITFLFSAMCAIRREVFEDIGPFNPELNRIAMTEEVDYGHRLTQHYGMLLTSAVGARHDHDAELSGLARKLFHRARARVPLYLARRRFGKGFETPQRAGGSLAALASVLLLALPALFGPVWLAAPAFALALSLALDAGMYGFVLRRRGLLFTCYFVAVHFLINVAISAGVGFGVLHWLLSARFRRLYDAPATPGTPVVA
jgi:GT2 family glycosyltransferase